MNFVFQIWHKILIDDANSKYIIDGFSYLEKDKTREYSIPLEEFVVLKLMKPFTGCGSNIIIDNFCSISLIKATYTKYYNYWKNLWK